MFCCTLFCSNGGFQEHNPSIKWELTVHSAFFKVLMCWCKVHMFSDIYVCFLHRLLGMQKRHVTTTAHGLGNSLKFISTSSFISRVPACGHIFWRSPELCFRLLKNEITTFSISCVHPGIHYQNCT